MKKILLVVLPGVNDNVDTPRKTVFDDSMAELKKMNYEPIEARNLSDAQTFSDGADFTVVYSHMSWAMDPNSERSIEAINFMHGLSERDANWGILRMKMSSEKFKEFYQNQGIEPTFVELMTVGVEKRIAGKIQKQLLVPEG